MPIDVDLRVAGLGELSSVFVQRFDSVIAMGNDLPALPPEDLPGALKEMRRVCREGGHLLVAIRDFSRRIPRGVWRDDGIARVSGRFVYDSPAWSATCSMWRTTAAAAATEGRCIRSARCSLPR